MTFLFLLLTLAPAPAPAACAPPPVIRGAASVQAFVEIPRVRGQLAGDTVGVTVCLVSRDSTIAIGSYRGELRFDSAAVRLVRVERGSGGGGMRLENANQAGRLIFAGAAPQGFTEPLVVRVILELREKHPSMPRLELSLQELSSVAGADLSSRLAVSSAPSSF